MSDAVVINPLERALSEDINNLQAMGTRQLADFQLTALGRRLVSQTGAGVDFISRSGTNGLTIRATGGGTTVEVSTGILSQFSVTWPAAPAPLESAMRLGYQRAAVTVPVPNTPSVFQILETRVVDVVTVNAVVDVFDVPTQTFIPTAQDKRIERQLEYQVIDGTGTAFPAFTGDPWVPIWGWSTTAGGLLVLPSVVDLDLRPDMQDILGNADQIRGVLNLDAPEGVIESYAMSTARPAADGDAGIGRPINGDFAGYIGDFSFRLRIKVAGGTPPILQSGFAPAPGALIHYYMVAMNANAVSVAPWVTGAGAQTISKGVLVACAVQPVRAGKVNSAAFVLDAGSTMQNFAAIGAGRALHVGTAVAGVGGGLRYMSQSSGGRALMAQDLISGGQPLRVLFVNQVIAINSQTNFELDFRGVIPDNARLVRLFIKLTNTGAGVLSARFKPLQGNDGVAPLGGNADYIEYGVSLTGDPGSFIQDSAIELPVFFEGVADNEDKRWALNVAAGATAGTITAQVDVIGWEF